MSGHARLGRSERCKPQGLQRHDWLLDLRRCLTLTEGNRALLIRRERIRTILGAGEPLLRRPDEFKPHDISKGAFEPTFESALRRCHPDLFAANLTEFRTAENEPAVISLDRFIDRVMSSESRLTVWTDAGLWAMTGVNLRDGFDVPEAHVALLSVDGADA